MLSSLKQFLTVATAKKKNVTNLAARNQAELSPEREGAHPDE